MEGPARRLPPVLALRSLRKGRGPGGMADPPGLGARTPERACGSLAAGHQLLRECNGSKLAHRAHKRERETGWHGRPACSRSAHSGLLVEAQEDRVLARRAQLGSATPLGLRLGKKVLAGRAQLEEARPTPPETRERVMCAGGPVASAEQRVGMRAIGPTLSTPLSDTVAGHLRLSLQFVDTTAAGCRRGSAMGHVRPA